MRYGSVCSGIEAATVAWHPLGWRPAFFAEIDKFPSAVLAHHYPSVPNLGDFSRIESHEPIDLLVGGTPCQSFSVAGLRGGLADDRGNLALEFLRLAQRTRARWLVWENVPGVLSSNGGRDFGAILGGMVELGYGFAYRVLDAQHFGVPQRRRRVFVVGHLGDWRRAAAVLFERHSLQGNSQPSREKGEGVAPTISARTGGGGGLGTDFDCDGGLIAACDLADTLSVGANQTTGFVRDCVSQLTVIKGAAIGREPESGPQYGEILGDGTGELAPTLRAMGHDGSHANAGGQVAIAFGGQMSTPHWQRDLSDTLQAKNPKAVAFAKNIRAELVESDAIGLTCGGGKPGQGYPAIRQAMHVRRLTPRECERLQGFPDDYTLISYRGKPAADGPRYKALGNSMAVPVMRWIGERIVAVQSILQSRAA